MDENKTRTKLCVHRSTSTQGNGTKELRYTIPKHLKPTNTRNISMVHTYTRKTPHYLRAPMKTSETAGWCVGTISSPHFTRCPSLRRNKLRTERKKQNACGSPARGFVVGWPTRSNFYLFFPEQYHLEHTEEWGKSTFKTRGTPSRTLCTANGMKSSSRL